MTAGELAEGLGIRFGALDTLLGRAVMYSDAVSQAEIRAAEVAVSNKAVARINDEAAGVMEQTAFEFAPVAAPTAAPGVLPETLPEPIREMILAGLKTFRDKGHEYTRGKAATDPIANFRTGAADLGCPTRWAWYLMMRKHFDSITTWAREGKVTSEEPIRGRLKDLMVYAWIGTLIVEDQERVDAEPE